MTNFTVGPTPLQIIGQGLANNPLTVQNTGAVSVYISADPGVSPNAFEYKIDAGGDFIWPSGKALSVCTGPGVIGQISYGGSGTVHVNSGSTNVSGAVTINGSVPISGPVTISGTVPISGNVGFNAGSTVGISGTVPISGSVNISGGTVALSGPVTVNGGVSVTGSTINIGNKQSVGSHSDSLIANSALAVAPGSTVIVMGNNVTDYQTLIIAVGDNGLGASSSNAVLDIVFYDSTATNIISKVSPKFSITGLLRYTIPVMGTFANVYITNPIGGPATFPIYITGTGLALPREYRHEHGLTSQFVNFNVTSYEINLAARIAAFNGAPAAVGSAYIFLPSFASSFNTFSLLNVGVTTNLFLQHTGSGSRLLQLQAATPQTVGINSSGRMAEIPLQCQIDQSAPSGSQLFTITW